MKLIAGAQKTNIFNLATWPELICKIELLNMEKFFSNTSMSNALTK